VAKGRPAELPSYEFIAPEGYPSGAIFCPALPQETSLESEIRRQLDMLKPGSGNRIAEYISDGDVVD
jgi:hypothetical protein